MNICYLEPSFRYRSYFQLGATQEAFTTRKHIHCQLDMSSTSNNQRTVDAATTSCLQTPESESSFITVKQLGNRRRRRPKRERKKNRRQEQRPLFQTERQRNQASSTGNLTSSKRLPTDQHHRCSEQDGPDSDVPDHIYESYNASLIDAYQWEPFNPREPWEQAQLAAFEEHHQDETNDPTIIQQNSSSQAQQTYHTPPTAGIDRSHVQAANQSGSTTIFHRLSTTTIERAHSPHRSQEKFS